MGSRMSTTSQRELKAALVAALKVAEQGLDGFPIPGVKGCITGILQLIEQEELRKANEEAFKSLLEKIQALRKVSVERIITELGMDNIPEGLKHDIKELASTLKTIPERYQHEIGPRSMKRRIKNFVFASNHAGMLNGLARELDQALEIFRIASDSNIQIELQKQREDARRRELNQVIASLGDSKYVERKSFWDAQWDEKPNDLCSMGTRVELLDRLAEWAAGVDRAEHRLLWLSGRAGTGKSTIAKTLASKLQHENTLGASFMFSRPNGVTDGSKVFTTLAYQLTRHLPGFDECLADALRSKKDSIAAEIPQQFADILEGPLSRLPLPQPPTVIIIDALDECTAQTHEPVMSHIINSLTEFSFIRVLVTSRPEHPFRLNYRPLGKNVGELDLGDEENVHEDIQSYLRIRLGDMYRRLNPRVGPDVVWPAAAKLERLAEMANGLFIFAATAARFICDSKAGNPELRMEAIIAGHQQGDFHQFPSLDRMYRDILAEALSDDGEGGDDVPQRYQAVVGAIVFSRYPLSTNKLVSLHRSVTPNYEAGDIWTALKYLQSVLSVGENDDTLAIHVYHKSFSDFITDPGRCTQKTAHLDPSIHHERLFYLHADAAGSAMATVSRDATHVRDGCETLRAICADHLRHCTRHLTTLNSRKLAARDTGARLERVHATVNKILPPLQELIQILSDHAPKFEDKEMRDRDRYNSTMDRLRYQEAQLAKGAGYGVYAGDPVDVNDADEYEDESWV